MFTTIFKSGMGTYFAIKSGVLVYIPWNSSFYYPVEINPMFVEDLRDGRPFETTVSIWGRNNRGEMTFDDNQLLFGGTAYRLHEEKLGIKLRFNRVNLRKEPWFYLHSNTGSGQLVLVTHDGSQDTSSVQIYFAYAGNPEDCKLERYNCYDVRFWRDGVLTAALMREKYMGTLGTSDCTWQRLDPANYDFNFTGSERVQIRHR